MTFPVLAARAAALGAPLDDQQLAAFELYRAELIDWNSRVNLTSVTDPGDIEVRHFVDSLTCLAALDEWLARDLPARLIDVGTGAGFPGLPLKIVRPNVRLTLLDSVGKKTAFVRHLVERLELPDVKVVTARAEELAREAGHRGRYDAAVTRALAPLPVLLELCLPFLRRGGRLAAPRRGDLPAQQSEAARAARGLGGRFHSPIAVDLGPGYLGYGLVVVDKVGPTPGRYPRRVGVPAKEPLA